MVYEIGRREPFLDAVKKGKDGRPGVSLDWFNMLYQVLLGQEKGPRFGSFVAVYGLPNAVAMIDGALARSDSQRHAAARRALRRRRDKSRWQARRNFSQYRCELRYNTGIKTIQASVEGQAHWEDTMQFRVSPNTLYELQRRGMAGAGRSRGGAPARL